MRGVPAGGSEPWAARPLTAPLPEQCDCLLLRAVGCTPAGDTEPRQRIEPRHSRGRTPAARATEPHRSRDRADPPARLSRFVGATEPHHSRGRTPPLARSSRAACATEPLRRRYRAALLAGRAALLAVEPHRLRGRAARGRSRFVGATEPRTRGPVRATCGAESHRLRGRVESLVGGAALSALPNRANSRGRAASLVVRAGSASTSATKAQAQC
jgi:hypothetical protein